MNETLKEILKILEHDARSRPEQIAIMVGRPLEEVEALIRQAEEQGLILRYRTHVDWEKLGEERVNAWIEVRVTPQRAVGFDAIARRIARFPEVRSMYLVSGTYDLAVLVNGLTMKEISGFVSEKLAPIEGVQGTTTHFLLKRYKEDGVLLEGQEELRRLAVTP